MKRGDIYLANFPFGDAAEMKLRPVLLLTSAVGTEVLAAYISSVVPGAPLATDIILDPANEEFKSTKLKVKSVLRLHKLATIHTTSLQRYLGKISDSTQQDVKIKLHALLDLANESL